MNVAANAPIQALTLAEAIDLAFRQQPRLRVYLEGIEQARRGEDIAFAPFLPMAMAGYSVGGFDVNAGGLSVTPGLPAGFNFIPSLGSLPVGLNLNTGYEFADIKLQWLICDFGRRMGRYRQAGLAVDIALLQSERAYQTVANEVAVAYYQVLRTRALKKSAQDAVRRTVEDLDVAKKLEKVEHWRRRSGCVSKSSWPRASGCSTLKRVREAVAVASRSSLAIGLKRQCTADWCGRIIGCAALYAIAGRVLAVGRRVEARIPGCSTVHPGSR